MSDRRLTVVFALVACAAVVVSFLSDGMAGHVPQSVAASALANAGSVIGNGVFLGILSVGLYLIGRYSGKESFKDLGKWALVSVIASGAIVHILKTAFERPRPSHAVRDIGAFLSNPSLFDFTGRFNSMPSGHTVAAFAFAYVAGRRFPRLAPLFYVLAAFVAGSRVYLGSHYPSDVVIGGLVGLGIGWVVTDKIQFKKRWLIGALICLTVFISFFKSGSFILFDVDEAVFSEAAREMVETGDYITPTYNYEPRYDKPILYYWFSSAAYRLGGVNEASARATSGVFGVLLTLMTFAFVRRIRGELAAYLAAVALLLNIEFFAYSHSAVTDMTLAFFIAAAVYAFYLAEHEGDRRWRAVFWAAAALAVLTKGIIGILFPVGAAFFYLAALRQPGRIKELFKPAYIALFLIIAAPWFIAEYSVNGREFFDAFIIKHHFQRYSGVISSHSGPVYFYVGIMLLGFFPWVAFLPGALWRSVKDRLNPESGLELLAAVWLVFVFVFFTISRTKLPNYIFPLFAPAAILASDQAASMIKGGNSSKKGALWFLIIISVAFGVALFALPHLNVRMDIKLPLTVFYSAGAVFLLTASCAAYAMKNARIGLTGIGLLAAGLIIILRLYALPPVNIALQKDLYDLSSYASGCDKETRLATYEINKPSIPFYARRGIVKLERTGANDITNAASAGPLLLITEGSRMEELGAQTGLRTIMTRGRYVLLGNTECGG
ncbi:MAG: phosphatase PAP2 family protein [Deltaproteobacteria bacterium]|nr:phosphatase PAP2 family protein [Deltaproteobacteria bacterium]